MVYRRIAQYTQALQYRDKGVVSMFPSAKLRTKTGFYVYSTGKLCHSVATECIQVQVFNKEKLSVSSLGGVYILRDNIYRTKVNGSFVDIPCGSLEQAVLWEAERNGGFRYWMEHNGQLGKRGTCKLGTE